MSIQTGEIKTIYHSTHFNEQSKKLNKKDTATSEKVEAVAEKSFAEKAFEFLAENYGGAPLHPEEAEYLISAGWAGISSAACSLSGY